MNTGSATIVIHRPVAEVFAAVADVTRMGDWSPECTAGRWVPPATEAAPGAEFEGDNIVKLGPLTVKRWTTTSRVSECTPGRAFEFVAEGFTTWRYEFEDQAGATRVTESFSHEPYKGTQRLLYETLFRRSQAMVKGMEQTLTRMKGVLESQ